MERTWKAVDKSEWPRGPWDDEPDRVQWVDEVTGLDCLIVRGPAGALCGYVGVPASHSLHGADYMDVDVEVHGGLTYGDACQEDSPEGEGICHIPTPGRPDDVWWLGFDCSHWMGLSPKMLSLGLSRGDGVYRDLGYVRQECANLAAQLAAVGS